MASVFTKIVNGDISAYRVAETDRFLAFLDVNPLVKGHTLVIPKKEIDYIFDVDDAEYTDMLLFAKKVALGLRRAVPCIRIGVAVIGLEVPHAHIHLIPLNTMSDINFSLPKLSLSTEIMEETAALIKSEIKL
jgi:histidine triad (HIT) family protein